MGIIVLAVAILPMLGVGGMQLYKAETPGPVKNEKLTPRITQTARALWVVYVLITLACIRSLKLAGMSWFDAVCHASRHGLGGFSTYDASIGHFDSPAIELVLDRVHVGLGDEFLASFHRLAAEEPAHLPARPRSDGDAAAARRSSSLGVALYIWVHGVYPSFWTSLRHVAFNLVACATDLRLRDAGLRAPGRCSRRWSS